MSRKSLPWFKCFPDDYLEGTRNLTLAQRGAYFDCLCLMYKHDGPIPDDDKWMSHQLHADDIRTWKAAKRALIASGKLAVVDGKLTNSRADREVISRRSQRDLISNAARSREEKKRSPADRAKKLNGNNGGGAPPCHDGATDVPAPSHGAGNIIDPDVRGEKLEVEGDLSRSPKEKVKKEKAREDFFEPSGTDGAGGGRLPFTQAVLADIEKLGVDPVKLHERYLRKTRGKHIGDPSAYLLEMARDQAAKSLGCHPSALKGVTSRNEAAAAKAQCAALGAPKRGRQALGNVITRMNANQSNGIALLAALKGKAVQ